MCEYLAVSFASQHFGATRRRSVTTVATPIPSAAGQVAITTSPTSRADRCTVSIAVAGGSLPGVAEVNLLLIRAGIETISLTSTHGVTRVTVPADAETAAVAVLEQSASRWEHQPERRHKRRFRLISADA